MPTVRLVSPTSVAVKLPIFAVHNSTPAPFDPVAAAAKIHAASLPLATSLVAADYVKIVSPSSGGSDRGSASSNSRPLSLPHAPLVPPGDPSTPRSAFGSPSSGSAGGTGFVVAALVGLLILILSNYSSRIALLVEAPLPFRRTLSLECPG